MHIDPHTAQDIADLGTRLSETMVRNTAGAVGDRIKAISKAPADPQSTFEYNKLMMAFNLEVAKIDQDEDATGRWERLKK